MLETLRWKNECLEMIDQRVLPAQFEYLHFNSAEEVANGIRAMVVRGAPAIGCAAAYGKNAVIWRNLNLPMQWKKACWFWQKVVRQQLISFGHSSACVVFGKGKLDIILERLQIHY